MEQRIRDVHAALVEEHGKPEPPAEMDPVDSIVHTVLSQNTADANTNRAWESLLSEFGRDYRAIEVADHDRLADAIRTAGLADQKATRIQGALRTIREHTGGEYSLEFIEQMSVDEARNWLTNIREIGPKTAGIVLLFRFGKPYFPVDTHCERLATRFDLIAEDTSAQQAHDVLSETVPDDIMYSFHVLLITHGLALVGIDRGFRELAATGWIDERPGLYAAQAAGCAPVVTAWEDGADAVEPTDHPDTICGSLEVDDPAGGRYVLDALAATGGGAVAVPDEEILEGAVRLADDGVPVSATGGAAVAGAWTLAEDGAFDDDATVVLVDPATANREADILRSRLMKQGI